MPPGYALSRRALLTVPLALVAAAGCSTVGDGDYRAGEVTLATGGRRGVYFAFGTELARVAGQALPRAPLDVVSTAGSVENLRLAGAGPGVLAFTALDAAAEAFRGSPDAGAPLPLRALARVYDDYLHVVVPRDSTIRSLDDLPGRTVSLGSTGSGTELIARRLLGVVGIDPEEQLDVRSLGIDESVDALADGAVDAFFWSGGLPTGGVADLARTVPLRLLPVEDPVTVLRTRFSPAYRSAVVPADLYGIGSQVSTLAVANLLVTHEDTDSGLVREVTALLFERRRDIAATVPLAGALDRRSAIFTDPLPLHEGALAYYRATTG